jgi:hypothetical protein
MSRQTCGQCKSWHLAGPLVQHGYGQCAARPEQLRAAITTTEQNVCRTGKFVAVVVPQGALL